MNLIGVSNHWDDFYENFVEITILQYDSLFLVLYYLNKILDL